MLPSARAHACMSSYYPYLYLFGGITQHDYSDEVWRIDVKDYSATLLSYDNPSGPLPSAFAGCQVEKEQVGLVFYIYTGETSGATPLDQVYKFTTADLTWKSLGPFTPRSEASTLKVGHRLLLVAGEQWSLEAHDTVHLMDLETGEVSQLTTLSNSIYAAASSYYKTSLYVFGGGDKNGEMFRPSVAVHNLFKLELNSDCGEHCDWPCSPGTYLAAPGTCKACSEGYYSDSFGLAFCLPCPAGTFSRRKGNTSLRQCYPCEVGLYSPTPGSRMCINCPSGYTCEVRSSMPSMTVQAGFVMSSTQPDLFVPGSTKVASFSVKLEIGFAIFVALTVLIVIVLKQRLHRLITSLDLFDDKHIYEDDVPIVKHKNFFGGFFSLLFMICASFFLIVAFLVYAWDNVEEIKALVPLATLEKENDHV